MCGICGFSVAKTRRDPGRVMEEMLTSLHHRGPDDVGHYADEAFAIGNRLLSIVGTVRGKQPFVIDYAGSRHVGVYNGEVYNWLELRTDLESLGIQFHSQCDSEVVIAAIAAWGEKATERFDGQWAVAVWDVRRRELTLARDPFGIKPLFYWKEGGRIAFASEPKALFAHPDVPRRPNEDAVREYLLHGFGFAAGYATGSRSFYAGISSLPPGHSLSWSAEEGTKGPQRRFVLPFINAESGLSASGATEQLREVVRESVCSSLMGDVPVATALSGGLDSSIITTIAAQERLRQGYPPLLACSIRYSQPTNPDSDHASLLAEHLKATAPIQLINSQLDAGTYLDQVDRMIFYFDEPQWELKQLAMFENYATLRRYGAKVVLTGEGADELFFGYYHRFPGFLHPVLNSGEELQNLWSNRLGVVDGLLADSCRLRLTELMAEAVDLYYRPYLSAGHSPARAMQAWYLNTFLHWLLIDNDRCSMAHSLEGRFPFLNRRVFELALSIDPVQQVGPGYGSEKILLRTAFWGDLPKPIGVRPKQPLPSPTSLDFHRAIADGFDSACARAPSSFWHFVSRSGVRKIGEALRSSILDHERRGELEDGGADLVSYLTLSQPWSVRTPQVFAIMTLARWWALNFD